MAALRVGSASVGFANGNLATKALVGPTNVSVGDLLYAYGGIDNDGQATTFRDGFTAPSGWTLVSTSPNALGGWGKVWRKVAVAADVSTTAGKSYTWAWKTGAACELFFIRIPAGDWDASMSAPETVAWASVSGTTNSAYSTPDLGELPKAGMMLALGWWTRGSSQVYDPLPGNELFDDWQSGWEHGGTSWELRSAVDSGGPRLAQNRLTSNGAAVGSTWLTMAMAVYPAAVAAPSNPDLPGRFLIGA